MKLTAPITVKSLRNLQAGQEIADGACRGLRARAREKGVVWSLMTTDGTGKKRRIEIGNWPDVGVPEARELAETYRSAAIAEKGPVHRMTLSDVLRLYETEGPALENKSWESDARSAIVRVFGGVLETRASELTAGVVLRALDAYPAKKSGSGALRYLRPALRWAERRAYTPKGVWADLSGAAAPVGVRDRVLTAEELARILTALGNTDYDGLVRMMLYTACRREEVCAMRFEDIIEDVWYIDGKLRKNGKPLVVPLNQQAIRLVGAQGRTSGHVFLGPKGGVIATDKRSNWDRWQKKFNQKSETSGWTRHDLRRTAATILGDLGFPPHIIEIVLGHSAVGGDAMGTRTPIINAQLGGVYNKSRYAKEHCEALEALGNELQGIEIRARQRMG